ncbi:MAG TPA: HEAT repeat domain-containing protein [Anaerolineae bacterium]
MTTLDHQELIDALTSGDDDRAEAAALALGRLGDAVLSNVCDLLPNADADVRWWATRTIGEIGTDAAIAALIGQCVDPDPDVRACAIYALGTFGERAAVAVPALVQRLSDTSVYVGQLAADSLARIGTGATGPLIDALKSGTPAVRGRAARALAQLVDQASIPALIESLGDESPIVEYYADIALQKMGVGTVLFKV